jgi:PAS domain S-box-containing protein
MKFMPLLPRKQSVHRKLVLVILASCCASMLVAGVALFVFLNLTLRHSFESEAATLAHVIAANCQGPLAFGDVNAANEVMYLVHAQEHVVGGTIRLPDGEVFARISLTDMVPTVGQIPDGSVWLDRQMLVQSAPIRVGGELLGTLQLVFDFGPLRSEMLASYVLVFVLTLAGALVLALLVAARARRSISDPIASLADSVRAASEKQDFTLRAAPLDGGEVGQLAQAFNAMLQRAEEGAALAKEITERRRVEAALRESEERFRSLFENAPIGLYRADRDDRFLMANAALLNLLGYEKSADLAGLDIRRQVCVVSDERKHFTDCLERLGMVEETEFQWRRRDGKLIYVRESAKVVRDDHGQVLYVEGCVEDITARKETAAELQRLNRELIDASRAAGMAEVATGVLHNVGNVLNSVSVSAQLVHDELCASKLATLRQAVTLLEQNLPRLGLFLTEDPKGRLLPDFLIKVTQHVVGEHARWQAELRQLKANIEHMKEVVAMQQGYARVAGLIEPLSAVQLVEDALRMDATGFERHRIRLERDYADVPPVLVDKNKGLQILINLIRNAKQALDAVPAEEKRLKLKISLNGSGRVKILIEDNGVGIAPENLTRIFSHGFTTRRDGHGFGLHSGALAAREMGGELVAESDGPGRGARFTLELPVATAKN